MAGFGGPGRDLHHPAGVSGRSGSGGGHRDHGAEAKICPWMRASGLLPDRVALLRACPRHGLFHTAVLGDLQPAGSMQED